MDRILFVDDRRHICGFWRRELEREGYLVTVATRADEAVQAMSDKVHDLVVTDVCLRGSDFGALRKELARRPETPIVVYTALRNWRGRTAGVAVGALVDKGEDIEALTETVGLVLARRNGKIEGELLGRRDVDTAVRGQQGHPGRPSQAGD